MAHVAPLLTPLVALLFLLFASAAHADAVPGEPDTCPEGAVGDTDHGGPFCRPTECAAAIECKKKAGYWGKDKSFDCKPSVGLCVKKASGGHGSDRPTALGECDDDGDCSGGATCVKATRCVLGDPPEGNDSGTDPSGGKPKSKCSCELAPASSTGSAWWLLGLAAFVVRRR